MPGLLYGVGLSQPTRSCLLLIKEANLDVEFKRVNMMAGEHKQAPYITEVNPAGQVPAYVEVLDAPPSVRVENFYNNKTCGHSPSSSSVRVT